MASIVSCRKKYVTGLMASLESCGVRPFRAEPDPCALLRAAAHQHRAPRKANTVLRLFLNERQGLAVAVAGTLPIVWRTFTLPPGQERAAIRSAILTLQTLIKPCGIQSALEVILIHGRKELAGPLDNEEGQAEKSPPIVWFAGPPLAQTTVAFGLALGCLYAHGETFDLTRAFKPPASLREIFPWREVVLQTGLLGCMALFLFLRSLGLEDQYQAVQAENARRAWLTAVPEVELDKEKKELSQKVEAIQAFLGSRVLWSAYTHDIATRLTSRAVLSSFNGTCEFDKPGAKSSGNKPKKSLVLHATVPVRKNGPMPQEIDDLLSACAAIRCSNAIFLSSSWRISNRRNKTAKTSSRWSISRWWLCRKPTRIPGRPLREQARKKADKNMDTNEKKAAGGKNGLLERLRDPIQLALITISMVLAGYGGIYYPLDSSIAETKAKLAKEQKRLDLACDLEHLREQFNRFKTRLPQKPDSNEWVQYLLEGIRRFPVNLVALERGTAQGCGPIQGRGPAH